MRLEFSKHPQRVAFRADFPGANVAMTGPDGRPLLFREEESRFDDSAKDYTWVFEYLHDLCEGQVFVFSTSECRVTGKVLGPGIRVVSRDVPEEVWATAAGPLGLAEPLAGEAVSRETARETWAAVTTVVTETERATSGPSPRLSRASLVSRQAPRKVDASFARDEASLQVASPAPPAPGVEPALAAEPRNPLAAFPSRVVVSPSGRAPKVSVVTCSYERPDLLRKAVESLREQTDSDWEHLIYDDASKDPRVGDTLAWALEDPRVRVWRGSTNNDRPAAIWNFLFDRARGRYFTVLDDDNRKLPRFVEVMSGELDKDPALDLVTCGWYVEDGREHKPSEPYHLNLSTCVSELDRISTCDGGAMLYRRETLSRAGYFSEAIRTNEDWDWLRRVVRMAAFVNLHDCLATYRNHGTNRMLRCEELGNSDDVPRVRARLISATLGVRVIRPPSSRLTRSQEDVCASVQRAIQAVPWIVPGDDVCVVLSPFQMSAEEIARAAGDSRRVLSLHMEDPYALATNVDRVRSLMRPGREVWVSTNDRSAVASYRAVVGDRVVTCPLLGADDLVAAAPPENAARDVDVLLCGYAYPSRRAFVSALLPRLAGLRVLLVGDGWEGYPAETMSTQGLEETYRLHARARAVVCLHRVHGDCSDGPVEPETANRGFMEGYFGGRVFLDKSRPRHAHDEGDVVWYAGAEDLAERLRAYLAGPRGEEAARFAEKCRLLYTYRARVARVLNCVRSPRFLAEVP